MSTHKALGRGLNALFTNTQMVSPERNIEIPNIKPEQREGEIKEIAIHSIRPNRHQPRTFFDPTGLEELAQSIKVYGVAQPLVVTRTSDPTEYEIVVGERRLRAAKLAGLTTVPCIIKAISNRQRYELAIIENLQRENLNALEEAVAIEGLMREYGLTQDQVANAIGKSRSTIANSLRFLKLHEDVQAALRSGTISEGHAKILAGFSDYADQLRYLAKILNDKLTVRDLENLIFSRSNQKKKGEPLKTTDKFPDAKKYEEEIQRILGRRVELQSAGGKKGWIRFAFYSPWDLEMLLKKLGLFEGPVSPPDQVPADQPS